VAESYAALKCSDYDQSKCTGGGAPNACCKGDKEKASKCDDMQDDWRKTEAKKFMSNADGDECCMNCVLGKDTDLYKASCTAKDFVGATVCGTNGKKDDARVYKPGAPIAFMTDCSTGPTHPVNGADDEEVDGKTVYTCNTNQAKFDAFYKQYQATGYKDLGAMTAAEKTAWEGLQKYLGPFGQFYKAVVSGAADSTKPALTMELVDGCIGLLGSPTLGPSTLAVKKGTAYVYAPTVLAGAEISVAPADGDSVNVWILAGTSEGKVTVTKPGASSTFYINDFTNGKAGEVSITGGSDVFISNVVNKGTVVATDTIGTAINIVNEGDIKIKGKSNINLVLTSNTGTIEFDDDATGTLSVPSDQTAGIKTPAGVTLTKTAAASPAPSNLDEDSASAAALASGALAMVFVAASLMF
jgi:hypothetical protein